MRCALDRISRVVGDMFGGDVDDPDIILLSSS